MNCEALVFFLGGWFGVDARKLVKATSGAGAGHLLRRHEAHLPLPFYGVRGLGVGGVRLRATTLRSPTAGGGVGGWGARVWGLDFEATQVPVQGWGLAVRVWGEGFDRKAACRSRALIQETLHPENPEP